MTITAKPMVSVLHSLVETCQDGQQGFHVAAREARNPALRATFRALSTERGEFLDQLQTLLRMLGEDEYVTGSAPGVLHRAWIHLKTALIAGHEAAVLAECVRGEEAALAEYDEAATHDELPPHVLETVLDQAASVRESLARLRGMYETYRG